MQVTRKIAGPGVPVVKRRRLTPVRYCLIFISTCISVSSVVITFALA